MEVLIAITTLLVVIVFLMWFIYDQRNNFAQRELRLMDRIMVRNWETLVQGESVRAEVKKSLTAEEIYELQQERGIPV